MIQLVLHGWPRGSSVVPVLSGLRSSCDPVWLAVLIARPMRDELELCSVKEVSGRRSVVDTGKSCIPTEIPSDLKFFFSYGIVAPPHPPQFA